MSETEALEMASIKAEWADLKSQIALLSAEIVKLSEMRTGEKQRAYLDAHRAKEHLDHGLSECSATPAQKALLRQELAHLWRHVQRLGDT